MTDTEPQIEALEFDEGHHHIADGPPFIVTLCGIDVHGQTPTAVSNKPDCPICVALAKEING